jgi:hypothetical protein
LPGNPADGGRIEMFGFQTHSLRILETRRALRCQKRDGMARLRKSFGQSQRLPLPAAHGEAGI